MTRGEVMRRLCVLLRDVWEQYDPAAGEPNDCWCGDAPTDETRFRHTGKSVEYVERVVRAALAAERDQLEKEAMSDEPCFECGQPSTRAAWDGRYSVPCCDSELCRADIEADREDGPLMPRPWPTVDSFAVRMRAQLDANAHKGGWDDDAPHLLMARVLDEVAELVRSLNPDTKAERDFASVARDLERAARAVRAWGPILECHGDPDDVAREAADVANMAMMVADVMGGLRGGRCSGHAPTREAAMAAADAAARERGWRLMGGE